MHSKIFLAENAPAFSVPVGVPERARRLRDGGPVTIAAHAAALLTALAHRDLAAATDVLEVAAYACRVPAVLAPLPGGGSATAALRAGLAGAQRPLAPLAGALSLGAASSLLAAFAGAGEGAAAHGLLACLCGRAEGALVADGGFAVRAGAGHPVVLEIMLAHLPLAQRVEVLTARGGELIDRLLAGRGADHVMAGVLADLVASQNAQLARRLLEGSQRLLCLAHNGRRFGALLAPLVALAGPDVGALIADAHEAHRRLERATEAG